MLRPLVRASRCATLARAHSTVTCLSRVRGSGFVDVDWAKVERAVSGVLDVDGDGKLTAQDARLGLSKLRTVLEFNLPGGTGFGAGLTYAVGGRLGRLAVLSTAACTVPTLATAHAYSSSPQFKATLEEVAPGVAGALDAAIEQSARARAALCTTAGLARAAAAGPPKLPTLEELRKEEARTRLEARLLTGDRKMTPQKQLALERCDARLHRIEQDKRAVKAQMRAERKR